MRSMSKFKQALPNALTVLRLFMSLVVFALLILGQGWIALWLGLLAAVTDILDGYLARLWDVKSDFGARYDPLFDKIAILLPLGFFTVVFSFNILFFLALIAREIVITYVRESIYSKGGSMPADIFGKIKTNMQFILVLTCFLTYLSVVTIDVLFVEFLYLITTLVTVWSGYSYLQKLRTTRNN